MNQILYLVVFVLLSCKLDTAKISNATSHSDEVSFIDHLKNNIDFNKCKHFVSQDFKTYSKRQKNNIDEVHGKLAIKGIRFFYPIDVMEYHGHSKDLAYTLEQVKDISEVYNELFEKSLIRAIEYSKNPNFKIDNEEYFQNGSLYKTSKSFEGKNEYNTFSQENDENGRILSFYITADKLFDISFLKDENGKYLKKELKMFGDNLGEVSLSFSETYEPSQNTTYYHFSFGTSVNSLMVTVTNDKITSLEQNVSCACPDGPNPDHGTTKEFSITLIDYDLSESNKTSYSKYWENGKYFIDNDWVFNLRNNTYYIIEYFDDNSKDTLSYEEGVTKIKMANNQTNLYGSDSFMNNRFSKKQIQWSKEWVDDKEIKFKSAITEFDKNGQQISRTNLYPNGKIKSIEK